ncbi:MAG: PIG-L deacetylase family protein [Anaerolineales bacterium]|jgi:LmbE family N-acetylglucosaminyl deacetylase
MSNFFIPNTAMAIFAHPDDIEYSCAGTLARWASKGTKISYVICTSGDVGIDEPGMTREQAGKIREAEQREAAGIVGASEVVFLREPDGLLEPTIDLRKKIVREIRRFRPEVVVCGDPTIIWAGKDYVNHPDHRAAATAALDAAFPAAGQPNLFEELEKEGITAHKPRKIYATSWQHAEYFVNIEETIDIKITALRAHKSQLEGRDPEGIIRDWAREMGEGKEMAYAEGFRVVTLINDDMWKEISGK